jgi:phosphohistidine phosphatase
MGKLMKKTGLLPDVVLSSPAARAKATAKLVAKSADLDAKVSFDDRIYEASPQGLRQVVSEVDDTHLSAMLVGHNPGIEGFIRFLTGENESMPTAALAVIELDIEKWNEVDNSCGELQALFRPRDEMKAS